MGTQGSTSGGPRRGPAAWFGWSGLAVVALLGLASSGPGGLLALTGTYVLVVAVVGLVRGRVGWAGLRGRALAGVALGAALGLLAAGGATAEPPPGPPAAPRAEPATPSPSPTPDEAPTEDGPLRATPAVREGTALRAVEDLRVKGRAPRTGYSRDAFGQAWFDADRNGCDTRNDVLRRDLADRDMKNPCKVLAGTLDPDPFTGARIRFEVGGPSEVDVDHVVALGDAWQKGAGRWAAEKRLAFGNDPLNLLAVDAGANRSKGDADAATWLPRNKAFRCDYVARQVAVKAKYDLWVTRAERDAIVRVLSGCRQHEAVEPGPAPTTAALPRSSRTAAPAPRRRSDGGRAARGARGVHYENCTAVRAAGAAPIRTGQPGYTRQLDRDGDGVACE